VKPSAMKGKMFYK